MKKVAIFILSVSLYSPSHADVKSKLQEFFGKLPTKDAAQLNGIKKQMSDLAQAFTEQAQRTEQAARQFSQAEKNNDYGAMAENARVLQSSHSMLMSLENAFRSVVDTLSLVGGYVNDAKSRQDIQAIMDSVQNNIIPGMRNIIMSQQEVIGAVQARLKMAAQPSQSSLESAYEKKAWQLIQAKNPTFGVTVDDVKGAVAKDMATQNLQKSQQMLSGGKKGNSKN